MRELPSETAGPWLGSFSLSAGPHQLSREQIPGRKTVLSGDAMGTGDLGVER